MFLNILGYMGVVSEEIPQVLAIRELNWGVPIKVWGSRIASFRTKTKHPFARGEHHQFNRTGLQWFWELRCRHLTYILRTFTLQRNVLFQWGHHLEFSDFPRTIPMGFENNPEYVQKKAAPSTMSSRDSYSPLGRCDHWDTYWVAHDDQLGSCMILVWQVVTEII